MYLCCQTHWFLNLSRVVIPKFVTQLWKISCNVTLKYTEFSQFISSSVDMGTTEFSKYFTIDSGNLICEPQIVIILMVIESSHFLFVTNSAKRDLIADPNSTHLESHNLTCEFGTTLKLGPNIPLAYYYCVV